MITLRALEFRLEGLRRVQADPYWDKLPWNSPNQIAADIREAERAVDEFKRKQAYEEGQIGKEQTPMVARGKSDATWWEQ